MSTTNNTNSWKECNLPFDNNLTRHFNCSTEYNSICQIYNNRIEKIKNENVISFLKENSLTKNNAELEIDSLNQSLRSLEKQLSNLKSVNSDKAQKQQQASMKQSLIKQAKENSPDGKLTEQTFNAIMVKLDELQPNDFLKAINSEKLRLKKEINKLNSRKDFLSMGLAGSVDSHIINKINEEKENALKEAEILWEENKPKTFSSTVEFKVGLQFEVIVYGETKKFLVGDLMESQGIVNDFYIEESYPAFNYDCIVTRYRFLDLE